MKLSLITSSLNNAEVIQDNLASVQSQVGEFELEHLLQDGDSTDGTLEHLAAYKEEMAYGVSIESGQDHGFYDVINTGVARSSGDIIGLLNADDFFAYKTILSEVMDCFSEDPELDVVYGDLRFVAPAAQRTISGNRLIVKGPGTKDFFKVTRVWESGTFSPEKFRRGWVPPHPTIYMRRRVWEQVGEYRLDFGTSADYEWLLRLFLKPMSGYVPRAKHDKTGPQRGTGPHITPSGFKFKYLSKVMVNMRIGGQSTGSVKNRLLANKNDRRAWEVNGLKPHPLFRFLKPVRKITQWT